MPKVIVGTENGQPIELFFEDLGEGKPVILIHGWPLSGRSWENQVPALIEAGYRVITYDRRGFGQSSQPYHGYDYDTFAADLDKLIGHLDLNDVTLVGFSMGGGEVARYVGTYGTGRVSKAVLASAVTPFFYKSAEHPEGGLDEATIQDFQDGLSKDRMAFLDDFTHKFFKAGDNAGLVSEPSRAYNWGIAAGASPKGTLDCVAAFGRTDFRGDLAKFDIPLLVIHGDSDAIVPFEVSGRITSETVKGSELVVIEGGPHGVNATHPEPFNKALINFLNH
ncbi:alpha/beta hydrolase [Paenibacillus rhizovicinus]|uniref:Alpha/beta hydrolase n=1 Tax=Paenibacillus rhizovicinus TaxID=2704463 RepID=A0A6C0P2J6_9BACL|nr:alpha/beta hydrolase [Paenibacillus rhizovicinus]QHW32734.1 alpha/beta hydrolase [Paenibacillus rhizovicinus]